MQNNVFQLPVNDNEQTAHQASQVEATPVLNPESVPMVVNSHLGQLSVELEKAGERILQNDQDGEWKEFATLEVRQLLKLGESIDEERKRVETESGFAEAA